MKIEKQFVTFEQAKLLKRLGFDIPLSKVYNTEGELWDSHYPTMSNSDVDSGACCVAPEQWMVVEWLRVVKQIDIEIHKDRIGWSNEYWNFSIFMNFDKATYTSNIGGTSPNSPQEAISAGIDYALNKLIHP